MFVDTVWSDFCKLGSFWKTGDLVFETMRHVQLSLDQLL